MSDFLLPLCSLSDFSQTTDKWASCHCFGRKIFICFSKDIFHLDREENPNFLVSILKKVSIGLLNVQVLLHFLFMEKSRFYFPAWIYV